MAGVHWLLGRPYTLSCGRRREDGDGAKDEISASGEDVGRKGGMFK